MEAIPLVRARYAKNLIDAPIHHGAPIEKFMLNTHLPAELLENSDGVISAYSLWQFFEDASLGTGISDLGSGQVSLP